MAILIYNIFSKLYTTFLGNYIHLCSVEKFAFIANKSPDQINIRKGLFHYPLIIIISERSSIYSLYFSGLST